MDGIADHQWRRWNQLDASQLQSADRLVLCQRHSRLQPTYLTDTSERPEGYGGSVRGLWSQHVLEALDYKTGDVKWSHPYHRRRHGGFGLGGPGILTTAGDLLFTGDYKGNLIAFKASNGDILWHFPMLRHSVMDLKLTCWMGNNMLSPAAATLCTYLR